jgi:hypothetical protein
MMFTYPWSFFTYSYGSIARYDVGEELGSAIEAVSSPA